MQKSKRPPGSSPNIDAKLRTTISWDSKLERCKAGGTSVPIAITSSSRSVHAMNPSSVKRLTCSKKPKVALYIVKHQSRLDRSRNVATSLCWS
eukprot:835427-Amphidinium_carterae.1